MSVSLAPGDTPVSTEARQPALPRRPSLAMRGLDLLGSFLVPLAAYLYHAALFGRWIVDDAAISFAYARNIADGYGIVHQPGAESIEGYSNPLWTGILTLLKLVGLFDEGKVVAGIPDYVLVPRVLGFLCTVVVLLCLRRVFGRMFSRAAAICATLLAGLLLAINSSYVGWTVGGLENPLYAALVAVLALVLVPALLDRRLLTARVAVLSSFLVLLLALTRPDGLIFITSYPLLVLAQLRGGRFWKSVRHVLLGVAALVVPAGLLLWLRYETWGMFVPNTAVAKAQNGLDFAGLLKVWDLVGQVGWPIAAVLGLLVLAVVVQVFRRSSAEYKNRKFKLGLVGLAGVFVPALGAFALLNKDWMIQLRFATPFWVTSAALFAALVVHFLFTPRLLTQIAVGVLVAASIGPTVVTLNAKSERWRSGPTLPACFVAERWGRMFNTYADVLGIKNASYLAPDLGGTLMVSNLRVYDLAGLMDRTVAKAMNTDDNRLLANYVFDQVKPTFIHIHGSFREPIFSDPRLDTDYLPIISSQDFVRKDAVENLNAYYWLRGAAPVAEQTLWIWRRGHKLASCGPSMSPGSPSVVGVRNP